MIGCSLYGYSHITTLELTIKIYRSNSTEEGKNGNEEDSIL